MPTYDGYLMPIPAGLTDNSRLTDQLASLEHLSFDDEMVIIASSIKGALTEGEIAENQLSLSGFLIPSFFDLFYNRIHIIPNFINFGDLASNQFRQVRVWNAYIDADKELENLIESGDLSGFDYDDITVPQTFLALEEKTFLVEISATGAPTFDGSLLFDFEVGVDDPSLGISGRRVLVFPFLPNWNTLPQEQLLYLTKIQEAEQDTEKRISFRRTPRRNLTFEYSINDSDISFESTSKARNYLEALLFSWSHRLFVIGIDTDTQQLTESLSFSDTIIENINTVNLDYDTDGYVLLYQDWQNYELIEIESFNDTSITLKKPVSRNWPRSITKIMPARNAKMALPVAVEGYNTSLDSATIQWAIENPYTSQNREADFITTIYKGKPIYLIKSDESGDTSREYDRKVRILDREVGQRSYSSPGIFGKSRFSINLVFENREMFSQHLNWLTQLSGRQKVAWFPTWAKDFFLVSSSPAFSENLIVAGQKMSSLLLTGTNRSYICIQYKDKELFFTKILSAIGSSMENTETLTIEDELTRLTSVETVERISFLRLARYDSDVFSFEYQSNDKILTTARLVELTKI